MWTFTVIVGLNDLQNLVDLGDTQVCRVNQFIHLVKLVPDLLLEYSLGRYREPIGSDEVRLTFIAKIWIVFQKVFELSFFGSKFPLFVFEHAYGSSSIDDEHLSKSWTTYMHQSILCGCLSQAICLLWLLLWVVRGSWVSLWSQSSPFCDKLGYLSLISSN